MEQKIIYSETDEMLIVGTEDLITLLSERLEGFYSVATMHRFKDLLGYLKCFKDYSNATKIIKPGSNKNGIYSMNGGCIKSVFYKGGFSTGNTKVMIFVPYDELRYLIRKVRNPKQLLWMDTAISEKFNQHNDSVDAFKERAKHDDCLDTYTYCINDVLATQEFYKQMEENMRPKLRIKNVIFNDPATIVFWYDGTKTVVKCQPGDTFDPEKGLAMAICKKVLGSNDSQSNFNDIFKKWLPKKEEKKEPEVIGKIIDMVITDKGLVVKGEITDPEFASSINESLGILGE